MDWLKDHSYIATWISPFLALTIALVRGRGQAERTSTFWLVIYLAFFTSAAATINPALDESARSFTRNVALVSFGYLLVGGNKKPD
jgi:hypothetical protein